MYLFFDTETTGLPRNWKAPVTDLNNWPRMVQIAWILFDILGTQVTSKAHIIKPEGFVIPHEKKKIATSFGMKNKICTMHSSTNLCRIPKPYGYKWPKLAELHRTLFGIDFEEAHNALVDIEATARCFWEMRRIGAI